jgi:hypothetical protein
MKIAFYKIELVGLLLGLSLTAFSQTEKVFFSAPGGFYETSFSLSLECFSCHHHIRYTTNGASPDSSSRLYEQPLWLDQSQYSQSNIYTIHTSPEELFFLPDSVQHCIVIRAAVFDESDSCISQTVTNTYLIRDLDNFDTQLGFISICADSLALFDYDTGILVPGVYWDSLNPLRTGNYYQKGRAWERLVNFEFHEPNVDVCVNQYCGLRTHGNHARRYSQKGLKIYAREEYGKKRFTYRFFEESPLNRFKHLVIKPYSSLYPYSGIQDYICTQTALDMGLEAGLSRPVLLFLNGEYWGIYFLQEKLDERYLEDHFDIDIDHCQIVGKWTGLAECGEPVDDEGNLIEFVEMMDWLETADLSQEVEYQHLCELVDIDNFTDYIIFETYIANNDWPANNMRCWKTDDGLWRWIFFDGDAAFNNYSLDPFGNAIPLDVFGNATYTGPYTWPSSRLATLMFRKCLENQEFVLRFESRMSQLCQGVLAFENMGIHLEHIKELIRPEIARQSFRFGIPVQANYWNWACSLTEDFLSNRVDTYAAEYYGFMGLDEYSAQESFSVYPNPANDILFVETCHGASLSDQTYRITNLMGQTIQTGTIHSETQKIDVSGLSSGLYFVTIGHQTKKFCIAIQ